MIKHHPSESALRSFVEGALPSTKAILISAHCDMCPTCLSKTRSFTESIAVDMFPDLRQNPSILREYISMFESITNDSTLLNSSYSQTLDTRITLDGREFVLPATLARFADRIGEWSHLAGKLWHASVNIGGGSLAQFIYMDRGASVPEHTHKGNELTLVINGKFIDGGKCYESGDFIELNQQHTHMPTAENYEGCLVVTILDRPLHFTSGWAMLINPLSQLYFKVNTNI
jgi:putative transcriptional regulator